MTIPGLHQAKNEREKKEGEHVVVIWLFYCLALVVKVLGRGYERSGSCQKPPESGYHDRPDWNRVQLGEKDRKSGSEKDEGVNK